MRSIASWRWSLGLVAVLAMTGCDATSPTHSPAPPPAAPCPATARLDATGTVERQGAGDGATLWALFFQGVVTAGQEIKVVWRMTGSGDFSVSATGPDGTVVRPVWGPEAHTGSNWARPGDEWGTGWVFPTAGCWTVNARRTSGSGYLVLRVAE